METKQPETILAHSADSPRSNSFSPPANSTLEPRTTFLQRYPALTHFAVLAALLTPIAAVPYLLSKKRISALSRRLDNVSATTATLRKELESSVIKKPKQNEPSATAMALRKELESSLIESARQREELSFTVTALRKELETSVTERAKQKEELSAATSALRKELKTSAIERAKQDEELKHTSASLEVARKEVNRLARNIEQLHAERETFVLTTESVQQLLQERKLTSERLALLPLLGNSLADVVAFMHKAEFYQGIASSSNSGGRRGVERLRRLALELQIVKSERPR